MPCVLPNPGGGHIAWTASGNGHSADVPAAADDVHYVGLFIVAPGQLNSIVAVSLESLNITSSDGEMVTSCAVRDLWRGEDIGRTSIGGQVSARLSSCVPGVNSTCAALLALTACAYL